MSIYQEGQHWRADVYVDGKRVKTKKGFLTRKDAKRWHDVASFDYVPEEPKKTGKRFDLILDRFEEFHLPRLALNTRRR